MKLNHVLLLPLSLAVLTACGPSESPDTAEQAEAEPVAAVADEATEATDVNPLLVEWETPFGAPPLDIIEEAHFLPAYDVALAKHSEQVEAIASNPEPPTFDNTLLAMQQSGTELGRISRVFFNLT
ncbi:MAG: hypothetical protein AAGH65_03775, partial [Pseudomonadota bacterium]